MANLKNIVFLVDGTSSMTQYLVSLRDYVLPQVIDIVRILFAGNVRIHAIVYRDYDASQPVETCINGTLDQLKAFIAQQKACGGQDSPEAQKTAMNVLHNAFSAEQDTIVIHYTDSAPHHAENCMCNKQTAVHAFGCNIMKEKEALKHKWPGFDWLNICHALAIRKNMPIFTFVYRNSGMSLGTICFYLCVAAASGGRVIAMHPSEPDSITIATISVFAQIMGIPVTLPDTKLLLIDYMDDAICWPPPLIATERNTPLLPFSLSCRNYTRASAFCDGIEAISWLGVSITALPQRLKDDLFFRSLCFDVFQTLFTPGRIMCLTYNAIFGKIWRMLCRFRSDDRLQMLCDSLSAMTSTGPESTRIALKQWLAISYDSTNEIIAAIAEVPSVRPFYALNETVNVSQKELLSLATCPRSGILAKVQSIICNIILVTQEDVALPAAYIPQSLSDEQVFSMILHLVHRGTMFTTKAAAIVALLALQGGNALLRDRANAFLSSIRGTWLHVPNQDCDALALERHPELLSVEYAKLFYNVPDCILTDRETTFFRRIHYLWRLRSASRALIDVDVGYTPQLTFPVPDTKMHCSICREFRSMTLMKNGICGMCMYNDAHGLGQVIVPEPVAGCKSYMVQCCTCRALYAIIEPHRLQTKPKCHYCRESKAPAPTITCCKCKNAYVSPDGGLQKPYWHCAMCTETPGSAIRQEKVCLVRLVKENDLLVTILGFEARDAVSFVMLDESGNKPMPSFFTLFINNYNLVKTSKCDVIGLKCNELHYNGKEIVNFNEVIDNVRVAVSGFKFIRDDCALCFEQFNVNALTYICGGDGCNNRVCKDCARAWWGNLEPGKLVQPNHLTCPFCKKVPPSYVLREFNAEACAIVGRKELTLDPSFWFAWCVSCYRVAKAMAHECGGDGTPDLSNFTCQTCIDAKMSSPPPSKECPGCGMATEKAGGCNHMKCGNPDCGAHWCFQCGDQFDQYDIYDHMLEEHGSYGYDYMG